MVVPAVTCAPGMIWSAATGGSLERTTSVAVAVDVFLARSVTRRRIVYVPGTS